jgi:hypothetical protein
MKQTKTAEPELTIEEKLRALFSLQLVDSEVARSGANFLSRCRTLRMK